MELQTKIPLSKQQHDLIDYDSKLLLLGSCFVENIGNKLEYYKFQNILNPFGILFQPLAIETLVTRGINKAYYSEDELFLQNDLWHCFEAHSSLSALSKEALLSNLNKAIDSVNEEIHNATHVVITLGTSWAYRFIETDALVANCHKVPQKRFHKELLTADQIETSLSAIIALIKSMNPKVSILLTVSPVRHLKDGFVQNTQSKAHLITAVQNVVEPRKKVYYFESYEVMMDELRDYRFYAEDMMHPNELAINYIWERFKAVWLSDESIAIMDRVETIQKGLAHKPFNPKSEQHQKFLADLKRKQEQLQKEIPQIHF